MPPQRRSLVDLLTNDEKVVMGSAVRMFCALRYRERNGGAADDAWYSKCIDSELDEINDVFEKYTDPTKVRIHPVITYVAEEWQKATDERRKPDFASLKLADVLQLCDERVAQHPEWNAQLHMKNLDTLVGLQKEEDRWWLPATQASSIAASPVMPSAVEAVSGVNTESVSTSARDAPTVNEDVEMEDDDGGETPRKKKAGKRTVVQSPTPARRTSSRRRKGASGDANPLSSPESEAGGRAPTKTKPAIRPPTSRAPTEPTADRHIAGIDYISSGDEERVVTVRRKRKRPASIVEDSASELETGPTDPGACGPCKDSGHKCKPHGTSSKALSCRLCIKRKIKCVPLSAASQEIANSRKRKHSLEDVIERLNEVSRSQKVFNTAIRDFIYNTDTMLRALCTQGQGNVNLASLGLRLPTVPLFSTSEPATPGASSVASGAPSSVSSLGLGRMMIDSSGVSGPSGHHGEPEDGESSRPGLRRRIAHSAPSSKAQSRAGSRQSSRGRK
ncbi:hypothetical protein H4582DRAFT_2083106 [Lactarius indigo]|nr:hypothetical protein H4582DRAFT_2083106 [Lactarius indigo]